MSKEDIMMQNASVHDYQNDNDNGVKMDDPMVRCIPYMFVLDFVVFALSSTHNITICISFHITPRCDVTRKQKHRNWTKTSLIYLNRDPHHRKS